MSRPEALRIYAVFSGAIVFSHVIGAILGDLVLGNRNSMVFGGLLQALGAFCFCVPSSNALYAGLFLVVLGNGFYSPNLTANFGKLYLDKIKLLDGAFSWLYLVINIGAFWGIVLIGTAAETYGFHIGFAIVGALMFLSVVPFLNPNNEGRLGKSSNWRYKNILDQQTTEELPNVSSGLSIEKRVLTIAFLFVIVGLFWAIYQTTSHRFAILEMRFVEMSTWNFPRILWSSSSAFFIMPVCLIAAIVWSRYYISQYFKLMLGFVFGTGSFIVLSFIPEVAAEEHASIYLLSLLLWGISEVCVAPIVHSILTKYTNPKYLAILISISIIPTKIVSMGIALMGFQNNPQVALQFGIIAMGIIGTGLLGFVMLNKTESATE